MACGWEEAGELCQQDTSEAFGFITEKLQLPLLTLKMDIYHTGTDDDPDDHKFINERLLEVAVPDEPGGDKAVQLEDCLEEYFNNRIEVVRRLERSNTQSSVRKTQSPAGENTPTFQNFEPREPSGSRPTSPSIQISNSPSRQFFSNDLLQQRTNSIKRRRVITDETSEDQSETVDSTKSEIDGKTSASQNVKSAEASSSGPTSPSIQIPNSPSRALISEDLLRHRTNSIIRRRVIIDDSSGNPSETADGTHTHENKRRGSLRKEVLMPAWQFFSLIRPNPIYLYLLPCISKFSQMFLC